MDYAIIWVYARLRIAEQGVNGWVRLIADNFIALFNNLTVGFGVREILDIFVIAVLIYQLLKLTKRTRASQLIKGLMFLLVFAWLAQALQFKAVSWLMTNLLTMGTIVLVILFQPELRRALEQIGRGSALERVFSRTKVDAREAQLIVEEIVSCLLNLSRRKVGALIVMEQTTGLRDVTESGTRIDSAISAALLENIFEPNTPLHDGAVIIRSTRIITAACVLPLTDDIGISRELGTRHRAAIGITESTDAIALIASEETGVISFAKGGRLTRYLDRKKLEEVLFDIYQVGAKEGVLDTLSRLGRRGKGGDGA